MNNRVLLAASALLLALTGCSATAGPAPTVTVTVTADARPAPTVTVTVSAAPDSMSDGDRLTALRAVSQMVTGVEETEPGRWVVHTSILDPRGDDGSSPEAQKAIAICERAVELGATYVSVMESNDSTFVLYGHPSYGNVCTIP